MARREPLHRRAIAALEPAAAGRCLRSAPSSASAPGSAPRAARPPAAAPCAKASRRRSPCEQAAVDARRRQLRVSRNVAAGHDPLADLEPGMGLKALLVVAHADADP